MRSRTAIDIPVRYTTLASAAGRNKTTVFKTAFQVVAPGDFVPSCHELLPFAGGWLQLLVHR
jgi:hypothetical protein